MEATEEGGSQNILLNVYFGKIYIYIYIYIYIFKIYFAFAIIFSFNI